MRVCTRLSVRSLTERAPSVPARRCRLAEVLKDAFVQYIALFIPIKAILSCLHVSLFQYGVVSARTHHPVKLHKF